MYLCMGEEFVREKDGIRIVQHWCFPIYVAVREVPHRPDPPPEHFPSIKVNGETPEWASELQFLATVEALAHRSPVLARELQAGLRATAHRIQAQLPGGVTIHFDEPADIASSV